MSWSSHVRCFEEWFSPVQDEGLGGPIAEFGSLEGFDAGQQETGGAGLRLGLNLEVRLDGFVVRPVAGEQELLEDVYGF